MEYKEEKNPLLGSSFGSISKFLKHRLDIQDVPIIEEYSELIQKIKKIIDGEIDFSNQSEIITISKTLQKLVDQENQNKMIIDFENSPIFDFMHLVLQNMDKITPSCGAALVAVCYSLINLKREQLNEFLPEIIGLVEVSSNQVLDSLIFVFSQILCDNEAFSEFNADIVLIIHNELTMHFFSLFASIENITLTYSLLRYFTYLIFIRHKNSKLDISDDVYLLLCEKGLEFINAEDEGTSFYSLNLCVQLVRNPDLIGYFIDNEIASIVCDFIGTRHVNVIPAIMLASMITNYEMIVLKDDIPSFFKNPQFSSIIIDCLTGENEEIRSRMCVFVSSTIPQYCSYYHETHIISAMIEMLPEMSFKSKASIINVIVVFMSVAARSLAQDYLSTDLIDEFETLIDPTYWKSSEEICQTLLDIMDPEILGYIRESSFPDTLEEFIDNAEIHDCADELMEHITGEYDEEESVSDDD